ncbi:MAG TPA: MFS transporter [Streptosporangiaceae bacterium]|nr:MFS transporter [Streptosporangiaceae bacterium]
MAAEHNISKTRPAASPDHTGHSGSGPAPALPADDFTGSQPIPGPAGTAGRAADVSPAGPGGEPASGRFIVFAIVCLALLMASVDQTIVATALPALQHDLHAPVNWSSWTITIYSLGQILVLPLAGKLGDQFGRRRIFLGAAVLFTTASLCCGFAGNIYLLIVLRAVQAIGGGAFMPSATGIVAQIFGRDRDRAVGLFSSIYPVGGIVGPVLGGLFVTYWSWRGIFLVNVPIGIALIVLGTIFIPVSARTPDQRLDLRSVALLGATLLPAMFGIAWLGNGSSVTSPAFLIPECAAAISLVAFVRHSARAASPFIRIRYLAGHGFGVMNLLNFLYGSSVLGFGALIPLYAHDRYGLAILAGGTLLTARGAGMIATSGVTVFLLRRTGYRWPILAGFSLTAAGLLLTAISPAGLPPYGWLAVAAAVCGIGMGISTPAANNATLQLAPDQAAALAGLRAMFRQTGSITAVSVTTAIVARSADPGITQAHIFTIFAIILVATMPLILRVPDHHGRW